MTVTRVFSCSCLLLEPTYQPHNTLSNFLSQYKICFEFSKVSSFDVKTPLVEAAAPRKQIWCIRYAKAFLKVVSLYPPCKLVFTTRK